MLGCISSCTDDLGERGIDDAGQNDNIEVRRIGSRIPGSSTYTSTRPIALGPKITNPYTLSIVNQAQSNLYPTATPLVATHRYIRFKPADIVEVAELDEWSYNNKIVLFDFPLDYEITEIGDYYIDPAVSQEELNYKYGSIAVSQPLPAVDYEIIDDLYLDESNPFLFVETFRLTDNMDKLDGLIGEGIPADVVDTHHPESGMPCKKSDFWPPPQCPPGCTPRLVYEQVDLENFDCIWTCDCPPVVTTPSINDCGCPVPTNPMVPAGCVQVETDFNGIDEVMEVQVIVYEWRSFLGFMFTRSEVVMTDRHGCWEANNEYENEVLVKVRFENENAKSRDVDFWGATRVVRGRLDFNSAPPHHNIHSLYDRQNDRREWASAHTINSDINYRDMTMADGVPQPRLRLNYTLRAGDGRASAAMLQDNNFGGAPLFMQVHGFTAADIALLAVNPLLPDITNQYRVNERARAFNGATMHELGHASHHAIVGEPYWIPYRNHIIYNGGYGTFPDFAVNSSPGHVALGEAIGFFCETQYGELPAGGEGATYIEWYIPTGLVTDLIDINPDLILDSVTNVFIEDRVSGFTPAMIFDALDGPTNIATYGDKLQQDHLPSTPTTLADYEALIDVYDVFN